MRKTLPLLTLLLSFALLPGSIAVSRAQAPGPYLTYFPIVARTEPPVWIGPYGGHVVVVAPSPTNPAVIYAGTWGAGVYRSEDAGVTWYPARGGLWNLRINAMAVNPQNGLVVYAGTYGDGVFKSTDGGLSWVRASNGMQAGAVVYTIAVDPENPNRLYAGTRALGKEGPPWSGIVYKSSDGGASWKAVLQNIAGVDQQDWVYSIAVLPRDPNLVLAAAHEYGVYRSWDYGESWAAANNGVTDGSGRAVAFDPRYRNPSTAYLGVWHRSGLFKTTSDGDNWELITDGIIDSKIYSMGLVVDRLSPNRLFAATFGNGVLRSTNSGASWTSVGFAPDWVYSVAVNSGSSSIVYAGLVNNGLYRSTNGGDNWSPSYYGISVVPVSSLVAIPGDPASLYAGTTSVLRTTNLGASWSTVGSGLPTDTVNELLQHPANPRLLYALTNSKGLYRIDLSTSTGWTKLTEAPPAAEVAPHPLDQGNALEELLPGETGLNIAPAALPGGALLDMAFAPSNSNVAYLGSGGNGVYRSADGGATWTPAGLSGATVWSLAVSPANPNRVYAATSAAGLVKESLDGGATWGNTTLPAVTPYALAYLSNDPATLFAGTSSGVYSRTGDGAWLLRGLSGYAVTALNSPSSRPGWIFAGTTAGAFYSPDGGNSWLAGPAGLEWLGIESITVDPNNFHFVYYATSSSGVYRVDIH